MRPEELAAALSAFEILPQVAAAAPPATLATK
jgi:hypothetical protein